jgi:proteic killer suppression protein
MIRSFRNKALAQFFESGNAAKLSVQNSARVRRILISLDEASRPEDVNLPGYKFHGLKGKDKGRFAVWATGNYRITFGWQGNDAVDVDLEDYH